MDANKQGFLRSTRSLIQTIGRCARNANGHVIMYADTVSDAMDETIKETNRRRSIQKKYITSIYLQFCVQILFKKKLQIFM